MGHVLLTDQARFMPLLQHNILRNGLQNLTQALPLSWGNTSETDRVDTLIMSDCVYERSAFPLLFQTLDAISPTEILFANDERGDDPTFRETLGVYPGMETDFRTMADNWTWEEVI